MEAERTCELLISGKHDAVDAARVLLLVMLDKLSGLHAESFDVDAKLLSLVAGRKRAGLHTVQEETATNIYYPSFFHGLGGDARKAGRPLENVVWVTGDFFNVQRARDKLLQIALSKVRNYTQVGRD